VKTTDFANWQTYFASKQLMFYVTRGTWKCLLLYIMIRFFYISPPFQFKFFQKAKLQELQ